MSRTDKDRPGWVQAKDPANRRFRMVGNFKWPWDNRGEEHFWKKLFPASQCFCCSHRAWLPEKRRRRSSWRREVRWVLDDLAQVAEDRRYWLEYARWLSERFGGLMDLDLRADNLERYFSFDHWNDVSENLLDSVDFDGCWTTQTWEE